MFYVNLPFGIAAALGLWWFLPATRPQSGLGFDWFGFSALAIWVRRVVWPGSFLLTTAL